MKMFLTYGAGMHTINMYPNAFNRSLTHAREWLHDIHFYYYRVNDFILWYSEEYDDETLFKLRSVVKGIVNFFFFR